MSMSVMGCVSNKPAYNVSVPMARSTVLETVESGDETFEIRYRLNELGQQVHKTVSSEGSYRGSDRESLSDIQAEAERRMIREAIDQVNGVFISAKTEIISTAISRGDNTATYRDFKDETLAKLFGFAKVQSKDCQRQNLQAGITEVSCRGIVQVPEVEMVKTTR